MGVPGLIILCPSILSFADYVLPLFQAGDEDVAFNYWELPLLLLLLVHLLSSCFPSRDNWYFGTKQGSSSSSYDADGYGLGSLPFLLLFFVLCIMFANVITKSFALSSHKNWSSVWLMKMTVTLGLCMRLCTLLIFSK